MRPSFFSTRNVLTAYERRCHPAYLSEDAHKTLSRPGAFDGLRVHTDEFVEVLARIKPRRSPLRSYVAHTMNLACHRSQRSSLTFAQIMDHMDWFDPDGSQAPEVSKQFAVCSSPIAVSV